MHPRHRMVSSTRVHPLHVRYLGMHSGWCGKMKNPMKSIMQTTTSWHRPLHASTCARARMGVSDSLRRAAGDLGMSLEGVSEISVARWRGESRSKMREREETRWTASVLRLKEGSRLLAVKAGEMARLSGFFRNRWGRPGGSALISLRAACSLLRVDVGRADRV